MNKNTLYKQAACAGVFLLFACILVLIYIPIEKYKTNIIAREIQRILSAQTGSTYTVGSAVLLKTPAQTGTCIFEVSNAAGKTGYACLVRITGICGPVPAVFICSGQNGVEFAGIAGIKDRLPTRESGGITDVQIAYWSAHIRRITENIKK